MSGEPDPASVRWKPLAMARNDSSTMTTSATATMVDSDSHSRCGMLFRLIDVTAAICSSSERMGSAPSERGGDLEPHGIERRNDAGDNAEQDHQRHAESDDLRRHREAGQEILHAGAQRERRDRGKHEAGESSEQGEQHGFAEHEGQDARAGKPSVLSTPISRVRSRMVSAMVLPTIIRMVTKAAPTTSVTIRAMLPSCAAKALLNAFSVSVDVSADELANIWSIAFATRSFRSGEVVCSTIQPIVSLPNDRVSSK